MTLCALNFCFKNRIFTYLLRGDNFDTVGYQVEEVGEFIL